MSPDASWVKWIVIGAVIVQTIAAVMTIRSVRAHVGLSPNERVRARPVPVSIKVGFIAVVLSALVGMAVIATALYFGEYR